MSMDQFTAECSVFMIYDDITGQKSLFYKDSLGRVGFVELARQNPKGISN